MGHNKPTTDNKMTPGLLQTKNGSRVVINSGYGKTGTPGCQTMNLARGDMKQIWMGAWEITFIGNEWTHFHKLRTLTMHVKCHLFISLNAS